MLLVDSIIFRQHKSVDTIQGRIPNISLAVALNSTRSKYIDRACEACIFLMNVHGVGTIRGWDLFYLPHASERMWEQVEGGKYSSNTVYVHIIIIILCNLL